MGGPRGGSPLYIHGGYRPTCSTGVLRVRWCNTLIQGGGPRGGYPGGGCPSLYIGGGCPLSIYRGAPSAHTDTNSMQSLASNKQNHTSAALPPDTSDVTGTIVALEVQTRSRHQQYSTWFWCVCGGGAPIYIYGGGRGVPLSIYMGEGGPPLYVKEQYSRGYVPPPKGVSAYSRTATGTLC